MKTPNKTLLDLNRNPTLDELRTFFKENDWSAAAYMELDYDNLPGDTVEALEYMKGMLDEHWGPLSREKGLKSHSGYYEKDNPLIAMRDNFENLISSGVFKLLNEQPEKVAAILEDFMDEDGNFTGNVDEMLHNAVEAAMKTMNYEEAAKIIQGTPAYEDFNHGKKNNLRAADFNRKWNHTRAKTKTVSLTDLEETDNGGIEIADPQADVVDEVIAKITQEKFWFAINDDDKNLLHLRMDGLTHQEIADRLGYKTHNAVHNQTLFPLILSYRCVRLCPKIAVYLQDRSTFIQLSLQQFDVFAFTSPLDGDRDFRWCIQW